MVEVTVLLEEPVLVVVSLEVVVFSAEVVVSVVVVPVGLEPLV